MRSFALPLPLPGGHLGLQFCSILPLPLLRLSLHVGGEGPGS
jgi:hypothetical protein